ncbi:MAG: di-trans,poly-cis-decaprenylcistransferase [Candidatus Pacebacteria bacterium]|nr:di-trans,poly-cis-decaprenylcistransferase [Candidatus Paceibacterota bacterium]
MSQEDTKIPYHLAIIMDGNRRWARSRGLPTLFGHKKGLENFKKIARYCYKKGVKILTAFAFSTENWNRSKEEVSYLMKLFESMFTKKNVEELNKKGVKINIIGQKWRFPKTLQKKIKEIEQLTKKNKKAILNIALSYGGRADIIEAIKKIVRLKVPPKEVNEELVSKYLWTKAQPDPDLIIRTGKEKRISNFLIWQSAYSELYFSNKHWPEFTEKDLEEAFLDYSKRKRRFGK